MNHEITKEIGMILLAGIVVLTSIGVLRDAGLTGYSTAELPAPLYYGPEKFFVQDTGKLTLDLNNYFSGEDLQYFIEAPAELGAQLIKNIILVDPEKAGDYELTVHASNLQKIEQQKIVIKVMSSEPKRQGCSCQR